MSEKRQRLVEIRWHGRGGQGSVIASELLAEAAMDEGEYFQAFPDYGPERMGAPVRAYTRISTSPIRQHHQIIDPDAVAVLDMTLLGVVDVTEGLKDDGALIVNTSKSPAEIRQILKLDKARVYTVDASRIAMDTLGRNIPNTPMIGAIIKATGVVSREGVVRTIQERLGARLSKGMVEANVRAVERALAETQQG
ncbi:MAG TPA: pyruvate synthase [Dehalococcoidia bacterium]|nr:pyruvate synthase [Dehalococcoidia bacterium]